MIFAFSVQFGYIYNVSFSDGRPRRILFRSEEYLMSPLWRIFSAKTMGVNNCHIKLYIKQNNPGFSYNDNITTTKYCIIIFNF